MSDDIVADVAKWIGGTGVGALIAAVFGKAVMRRLVEDGAATEIINNLRDEVSRLADVNEKLARRVNLLQEQVVNLTTRNGELQEEIAALNMQVRRMRATADFCDDCPKLTRSVS